MTPEARERIRDHRDELEDLAASDLPCAWIAETLLDAVAVEV